MSIADNEEIRTIRKRLIESMLEYMDDVDVDYTNEDVQKCSSIIDEYLQEADQTNEKDAFMNSVKKTVLKLNELNEKVSEELIETDQREDICEIIIKAGFLKGFNEENEDITEEWREW